MKYVLPADSRASIAASKQERMRQALEDILDNDDLMKCVRAATIYWNIDPQVALRCAVVCEFHGIRWAGGTIADLAGNFDAMSYLAAWEADDSTPSRYLASWISECLVADAAYREALKAPPLPDSVKPLLAGSPADRSSTH